MLKWLAVVAVVLSVAQATMPTSGQASNKGATGPKKQDQSVKQNENPSPTTTPISVKNESDGADQSISNKASDHDQRSAINIANSAPMSETWSWHDKLLWIANLIFAAVGIGGVWIAICTLKKIERQTKATEDAVENARDTAKKQLRAYMCVSLASLNFRDDSQIKAQIEMENMGQTPAFEVRIWVDSIIREHPLLSPFESPPANLVQSDAIIGPGRHHIAVTNPLYGKEIDFGRGLESQPRVLCVRRVFLSGYFQETSRTEFSNDFRRTATNQHKA
jgi:hypothetical protein